MSGNTIKNHKLFIALIGICLPLSVYVFGKRKTNQVTFDKQYAKLYKELANIPKEEVGKLQSSTQGNHTNYTMRSTVDTPAPTDPKEILKAAEWGHCRMEKAKI